MKGNPYSDRDQVNEISHLIKPPCCLYMTAGRSLCSVSLTKERCLYFVNRLENYGKLVYDIIKISEHVNFFPVSGERAIFR